MNYGNRQLQSQLAAQYVLGSLRGPARRRFERLLESEPGLREETEYWQRRLNPLAETVRPVRPPRRVWKGIRRRIRREAKGGLRGWITPEFRRSAGLAGLMLLIGYGLGGLQYADWGQDARREYVAVLENDRSQPMLVASLVGGGRTLKVEMLGGGDMEPGKVMQVWCVPQGGATPVSLGMFVNTSARFELSAEQLRELRRAKAIAISLEPAGGSPREGPSGPVMYQGNKI